MVNGTVLTREQARILSEQLHTWIEASMGSLTDYGLNESILKDIMKKVRHAKEKVILTDEESKELSKAINEYMLMFQIDILLEIKKKLDV